MLPLVTAATFTSTLLGATELAKLQAYFNSSSLSLKPLYASNGTNCSALFKKAVPADTPNVLMVARSLDGKLIGGFRKAGCKIRGRNNIKYLLDPSAFVFSLSDDAVFYNKAPKEDAVSCTDISDVFQAW